MTRAFLKSLLPKDLEGLDGVVDSIMQAHGTGIESEKAKTAAAIETSNKLVEAAKKTLDDTRNEYEARLSARGDESEAEKKLAALQTEFDAAKEKHASELQAEKDSHEATKTEHETERTNATMDSVVGAALKEAGYSEAAIPLFLKAGYDRAQLKKDADGKFADVDKFVESVKADTVHAAFFGEMRTEGANVGGQTQTPPKVFTREAIAKMTPEEINKNWDAVQAAMKSK